jgi:hypothetical protein
MPKKVGCYIHLAVQKLGLMAIPTDPLITNLLLPTDLGKVKIFLMGQCRH